MTQNTNSHLNICMYDQINPLFTDKRLYCRHWWSTQNREAKLWTLKLHTHFTPDPLATVITILCLFTYDNAISCILICNHRGFKLGIGRVWSACAVIMCVQLLHQGWREGPACWPPAAWSWCFWRLGAVWPLWPHIPYNPASPWGP